MHVTSHPIEDTSDDDARRVVYCKVPAFRLDIREVENLGEGIGSDVPNAGLVLGVPVVADVEDGGLDGGYGFEVSIARSGVRGMKEAGVRVRARKTYLASLRFLYFSLLYSVLRE